jgi:predicted metal-dependent phosphoesterase TrpH
VINVTCFWLNARLKCSWSFRTFAILEETIRRIHSQGGAAIMAHPYLGWNSIWPHGRARHLPFDAIEIFNFRCGPLLWPNFFAKAG